MKNKMAINNIRSLLVDKQEKFILQKVTGTHICDAEDKLP